MAKKLGLFLLILGCLAAAPSLMAEEASGEAGEVTADVAPEVKPATETEGVSPSKLPPVTASLEEYLSDPMKVDAAGCSAFSYCIHGGSVSCSAPSGTCTSSGAKCGGVICNGQATWCGGSCYYDHHCFNFCGGDFDATCDQFGCCECS